MLNQGCSLSCTATGISGGRGDGWCEGDPEAPREMDPQMFLKAADVDENGFVNPDDFFLVARQMALGSYDPTYDICSDGAISPDNVINVLDTSCMLRAIEIQLRNL